jgi:hypothetical protein
MTVNLSLLNETTIGPRYNLYAKEEISYKHSFFRLITYSNSN